MNQKVTYVTIPHKTLFPEQRENAKQNKSSYLLKVAMDQCNSPNIVLASCANSFGKICIPHKSVVILDSNCILRLHILPQTLHYRIRIAIEKILRQINTR